MLAGELYLAEDPVIAAEQGLAHGLQERYNGTRYDEQELRDPLLRELLGTSGTAWSSARRSAATTATTSGSARARSPTTTASCSTSR